MRQDIPSSPTIRHWRTKHVPLRTCVACRCVRPKREMVRIVRTMTGRVEVDPTGKKPGRGAYLCRTPSCWEIGLKKNSLSHTLKATLGADERKELGEFVQQLVAQEGTSITSEGSSDA